MEAKDPDQFGGVGPQTNGTVAAPGDAAEGIQVNLPPDAAAQWHPDKLQEEDNATSKSQKHDVEI